MSTGSKSAIARAIVAKSRRASASPRPHRSSRTGHAISVRSCGCHSAGIESPAARGVSTSVRAGATAMSAHYSPGVRSIAGYGSTIHFADSSAERLVV
jgi:hypothetical protein